MTSPQDPPVRNRQKRRRTKQLAAWRETNAAAPKAAEPKAKAPAAKAPAAKAPAKKATK